MNTNPVPGNLHQMVCFAASNSIPKAVQRNSFIVNEVAREFEIATDETILTTLLNNLLSEVVQHTKDSCIRIKAKEYDDIICVVIKDNSMFSNYSATGNLAKIKQLAKKMKGSLSIRNMEHKFTTILISFPTNPNFIADLDNN